MPRRKQDYDAERFRELLTPLLEESGESYRQASMSAGLDETAISRYLRGSQPMRDACIALADHFGVNPNKILEAAGYEPLRFFDRRIVDPAALPPDVNRLIDKVMAFEDDVIRERIVKMLLQFIELQRQMKEEVIEIALEKAKH